MKTLALTILAIFLINSRLQADGGSCVVYQAKFYLKNGTMFTGSVEAAGYYAHNNLDADGRNSYCSNVGMLELVKILQREGYADQAGDGVRPQQKDHGKLPVYKKLYTLQPRPRKPSGQVNAEAYGFLGAADVVFIDSSEVRRVVFISAARSRRSWAESGMVAAIPGLIDTVRQARFWNDLVVNLGNSKPDSLVFGGRNAMLMQGYRLINYNAQINAEELARLARLKFTPQSEAAYWAAFRRQHGLPENGLLSPALQRAGLEQLDRQMQQISRWFWQKGIVVVRINGTC